MSEYVSNIIQSLEGQDTWRAFGDESANAISNHLPQYFAAKGFRPTAVSGLGQCGLLGKSIDTFMLGNNPSDRYYASYGNDRQNFISDILPQAYSRIVESNGDYNHYPNSAYEGTLRDNRSIMEGITEAAKTHERRHGASNQRQFRRNGASRHLIMPSWNLDSRTSGVPRAELLAEVPIAIVGGGASGVLSSALFNQLGFNNITVFDKRGKTNGLWNQDNVRNGTKNNPFELRFGDAYSEAADRTHHERSGLSIERFLNDVTSYYGDEDTVNLRTAKVKRIKPGDLNHAITFIEDGQEKTEKYPIVIYAPGIGEPLDPNDPSRMSTPMKKNEVGQRWQRQFEDYESFEKLGKRVVLIGLGNSTAEVVQQLQSNRSVDYRILTHRSLGSLLNPTIDYDGKSIYRDTSKPELTSLAGDLRHIDNMFTEARDRAKIVPGIKEWHHEGNVLTAKDADGIEMRIPFDTLFTLTGYGQNPKTNEAMGLTTQDKRIGSINYDFDGEVQRGSYNPYEEVTRRRVHPGYFALGPILKNDHNPNALVIPGIHHQLQQLSSTLMIRAAEVVFGRRKNSVQKSLGEIASNN